MPHNRILRSYVAHVRGNLAKFDLRRDERVFACDSTQDGVHSLRFLAARVVCKDTVTQCVDLIRHGPLPRPDVLEMVLMLEEAMVMADQYRFVRMDEAYVSCVMRIVRDFSRLIVGVN